MGGNNINDALSTRRKEILFFLHGYESLIGPCAFSWADLGGAADRRSFGENWVLKKGNFLC